MCTFMCGCLDDRLCMKWTKGFCVVGRWIGCLLLFLATVSESAAAFTLDGSMLSTGGGEPLVSLSEQLTESLPERSAILFRVGFGTDELPTAGEFKDSFSVSLLSSGQGEEAIYFTIDIFGAHWLPNNPGGVSLDGTMLMVETAEVPGGLSGYAGRTAFNVRAEIPLQYLGKPVGLHLDLFDNGNSLGSAGYIDNISVVPEPAVLAFGALIISSFLTARKFRK